MNDDRTLSELRKDVAAAALMLLAVLGAGRVTR